MILILDDDHTSLFLLSTILRRDGHPAMEFDNASAALDYLRAKGGVSLIICDLRMPGMSGLDFLATVRTIATAHFTPILCCSSAHDAETVQSAIDKGIRDFIVKPIDPTIVRRKVNSILCDTNQTVSSRETVTSRLGITGAEYRELVCRTLPSVELLIADLELAIERGDAASVGALAERIEEPASVFDANRCLAAIVDVLAAPDDPRRLEAGLVLAHETLLFRSAIERSTANLSAPWQPHRAPTTA